MLRDPIPTRKKPKRVSMTNIDWLIPLKEKISVHSDNHTKKKQTPSSEKTQNYWSLKQAVRKANNEL